MPQRWRRHRWFPGQLLRQVSCQPLVKRRGQARKEPIGPDPQSKDKQRSSALAPPLVKIQAPIDPIRRMARPALTVALLLSSTALVDTCRQWLPANRYESVVLSVGENEVLRPRWRLGTTILMRLLLSKICSTAKRGRIC